MSEQAADKFRPEDVSTISQVIEKAQKRLDPHLWDYVSGGAGREITLESNRAALDSIQFRPRVLRDVQQRRTDVSVLGLDLSTPIMLAPIGGIGEFDPDGGLAAARAAAACGTASWVSVLASPTLEDIAQSGAPLILQVYVRDDSSTLPRLVTRGTTAGYRAICLTVDSAVYSRRERDLRNGFNAREHKQLPNLVGTDQSCPRSSTLTWDDVEWLRGYTELPLILKGILDPRDAQRAASLGVDAIVVSNHGGRQLDSVPPTMQALADVVDAVGPSVEVIVDGGFQSGADVAKAIAVGARGVLIGKLQCWALAVGGEPVLRRVLDLLTEELSLTVGLLGLTSPQELTREYVSTDGWISPWTRT